MLVRDHQCGGCAPGTLRWAKKGGKCGPNSGPPVPCPSMAAARRKSPLQIQLTDPGEKGNDPGLSPTHWAPWDTGTSSQTQFAKTPQKILTQIHLGLSPSWDSVESLLPPVSFSERF